MATSRLAVVNATTTSSPTTTNSARQSSPPSSSLLAARRKNNNDFHTTISPKKLLCEAALNGNLAKVKSLIVQHDLSQEDVRRAKDGQGRSSLVLAAMNGHLEVVQHLCMAGASVNMADSTGCTPLMWAVRLGNLPLVEYLTAHGARLEQQDTFNFTAIVYAAHYENAEVVRVLSSRGAVLPAESLAKSTAAVMDAYKRGQQYKRFQDEQQEKNSVIASTSHHALDAMEPAQAKRLQIMEDEAEILSAGGFCNCRLGEGRKCNFFEAEAAGQ